MTKARPRLFLFSGPVEADDPLDPIAPLAEALAGRAEIVDARRLGDVSERSAARMFQPGVDAALHDLTDAALDDGARALSLRLPGAVLLAADRPFNIAPGAPGGLWRVPAPVSALAPSGAEIVAADASVPGARRRIARLARLRRAAPRQSQGGVLIAGAPAALYATLLALKAAGGDGHAVLLAPDDRAAAEAAACAAHLGLGARVAARAAVGRRARAALAMTASRVIEINPLAWPGATDLMVAAAAVGGEAARVEGRPDELPDLIGAALSSIAPPPPAPPSPEDAAETLWRAAEAARRALARRRLAS